MDFVCIDFETANSSLASACSLGVVSVKNGKIDFQKEYLINPQCVFSDYNILIHKITPSMVEDAKTFPELWDEIKEIIDGRIVFAHAADFDIGVLNAMIERYSLDKPDISIGCTLRISKIAFKDILPNCKLNTISRYLNVEHEHHNGLSDALVCYYIIKYVKRMYQVYDVVDLFNDLSLLFGKYNEKEYYRVRSRLNQKNKKIIKDVLKGKVVAFTGKPDTMTKKKFMELVVSYGGIVAKDYNHRIDIFVEFTNPQKKHLELIEKLNEIKEIKICNERQFMEIINDDK